MVLADRLENGSVRKHLVRTRHREGLRSGAAVADVLMWQLSGECENCEDYEKCPHKRSLLVSCSVSVVVIQ